MGMDSDLLLKKKLFNYLVLFFCHYMRSPKIVAATICSFF